MNDNKKERTDVSEQEKAAQEAVEEEVLEQDQEQQADTPGEEETPDPLLAELEALKAQTAQQEDKYLRLAAEYENYRRRTAKEKETIWSDAKGEAAAAFLPVYDNLERALKQETADEAYKKGVEMTMNQLKSVLEKLGITEVPALGQPFDPKFHNAVMHVEDESLGENTVAEVFQSGFQLGEKVIRFAMVKVAN
jgi:molecular chaperone GrpE